MFDTGIKENIVNDINDINWDDPILKILGGGRHDVNKMRRVSIMAPIAERPSTGPFHDSIDFGGTLPAVGDLIVMKLVFKSLKAGFADFDNCNVTGGKTLSISFAFVSLNDTAIRLSKALMNADVSYSIANAIDNASATEINFVDTSVYLKSISLVGEHNIPTTLTATILHSAPAKLGRNTSKELKDSVRAATKVNYGPEEHTVGKQVDMNNNYYAISFDILYRKDESAEGGIINGHVDREAEFIYYINESIWAPSLGGTTPLDEFMVELLAAGSGEAANISAWLADINSPIYFDELDAIGFPA